MWPKVSVVFKAQIVVQDFFVLAKLDKSIGLLSLKRVVFPWVCIVYSNCCVAVGPLCQ